MSNLRTTTSNEKVRNYHRDFYRPDNLCLIITGKVAPEEVFKALEPFEQKIKSKVFYEKVSNALEQFKPFRQFEQKI